jgi:hypothetical protein
MGLAARKKRGGAVESQRRVVFDLVGDDIPVAEEVHSLFAVLGVPSNDTRLLTTSSRPLRWPSALLGTGLVGLRMI